MYMHVYRPSITSGYNGYSFIPTEGTIVLRFYVTGGQGNGNKFIHRKEDSFVVVVTVDSEHHLHLLAYNSLNVGNIYSQCVNIKNVLLKTSKSSLLTRLSA